ncbi:MAG: dihydroorotase [Bacteroidota bacterium]
MEPKLLIKNARIITASGSRRRGQFDILIEKGKIASIGKAIKANVRKTIDLKGAFLSPGWFDVGAFTGDPGYEHKEDLTSVSKAAAAGGFTGVACLPNTNPVIHSKSEVLYVINKTNDQLVEFLPIGAVSQNCEGKEITEMYDMYAAGAVAFSDGFNAIQNSGLMMRSLLYVKPFDGVIINQAHDDHIAKGGQLNEGKVSTMLGLKGIPGIAEDLMVQRDLYLAEYTDSRLHLANLSCARSVALVKAAKSKGIRVTASVNPMNISFEDGALVSFDANLKVMPPIRSEKDRKALVKGLEDGTIDMISSNHIPQDSENKHLEFSYAGFGVIGLETTYAAMNTALKGKPGPEFFVEKLAIQPRNLLGIPVPKIEEGEPANLSFFDPKATWIFSKADISSKSSNSPFIGQKFSGKVIGVYNRSRLFLN